jgi:hypothetical protein
VSAPTPDQQVQFLLQLQRLLDESLFSATYKYALLLAIADVCVEIGDDSGEPFRITTRELAAKFVFTYWRQAKPYEPVGRSGAGRVLKQNTGKQAAILEAIAEASRRYGSLGALMREPRAWDRLVGRVAGIVAKMPLWKLQHVGGQTFDFLYSQSEADEKRPYIELRPGVAYCFRRFHALVRDLVTTAWTRFVRGVHENADLLREGYELGEFLFGSPREALSAARPLLTEVQHGTCFYCGAAMKEPGEVDHFIPWSRYPINLGHNFVLAHRRCNEDKSDRLAAMPHLERWSVRNADQGAALAAEFSSLQLAHDLAATCRIARWAYDQAESAQAQVWVTGKQLVAMTQDWRALLGLLVSASQDRDLSPPG